ncbi:MAG: ABC transporter substrate-binding protein, partial [Mycobacterium sp.]|nr:ABC transporter substrate-binding protein [Mycobacterium sp.]
MTVSRITAPLRSGLFSVIAGAASVLLVLGAVACAPAGKDNGDAEKSSVALAGEATSAEDFGGMNGLIEAAKAEGELNVIALPSDWANYGAIIAAFSDKYGIKVNSAEPDGSSQDEINAANQQ